MRKSSKDVACEPRIAGSVSFLCKATSQDHFYYKLEFASNNILIGILRAYIQDDSSEASSIVTQ
jgi:hypothetical protein